MDTAETKPDPSLPVGKWSSGLGFALFCSAAVFYFFAVAPFPYPSEWLSLIATASGLDPFASLTHPLWALMASTAARIPGLDPAVAANVFSAICGALSIGLVYSITSRIPLERSKSQERQDMFDAETAPSRRLGGVVAALYAAASLPIFIVSTRAHPLALGGLLFLLAIWLTSSFRMAARLRTWLFFSFLYGLGCVESPAFLLAAPAFAFVWCLLLWRAKRLKVLVVLGGLALFAMGTSTCFYHCWKYYHSPIAQWREFKSYGMVLQFFMLDQYHALRFSVPRFGWLSIFLTMIAPGLMVFSRGTIAATDTFTRLGVNLFRIVLALLASLTLFDWIASPWRLAATASLVVTPYWITAIWTGHMIGAWYYLLGRIRQFRRPIRAAMRAAARPALLVLTFATIAVAGWKHYRMADVRLARPVVRFARDILASMEGRTWLVTDGALDSLLRLESHKHGEPIHLINRAMSRSDGYLRYLATLFDDPERKGMTHAGLQPVLDVWFERDPDISEKLAVMGSPDLWLRHGLAYQPNGLVNLGRPRDSAPDALATFASETKFLSAYTNVFVASNSPPALVGSYYRWAARILSLQANNLGVMMADAGRTNEALQAYRMAQQFDAANLSAWMNEEAMTDEADRGRLRLAIKRLAEQRKGNVNLMILASEYGYVRSPVAVAQEGMAMALTGQEDIARDRMKSAMAQSETNIALQLALARMLVAGHQDEQTTKVYTDILRRDSSNKEALANMLRVELARGHADNAEALLKKIAPAGSQFALERGLLLLAQGKSDEARNLMLSAAREDDTRSPLWLALAMMAQNSGDRALLDEAVGKLEKDDKYVPGQLFMADLSIVRGDPKSARAHIERAQRLEWFNVAALEKLVTLDILERDHKAAARHAADLLNLDYNNAAGNYVMGILFAQDGKFDLAEASLRRSVNARATAPALNDLAWLLQSENKLDEALKFSEQSTDLMPAYPLFWCTRGLILGRLKRTRDAAESFDRALQRGIQVPDALLMAAAAYVDNGETDKARQVLAKLQPRVESLSAEQKKTFEHLGERLANSNAPPVNPGSGP